MSATVVDADTKEVFDLLSSSLFGGGEWVDGVIGGWSGWMEWVDGVGGWSGWMEWVDKVGGWSGWIKWVDG